MSKSFTWIIHHHTPKISITEMTDKCAITMGNKTNLFTHDETTKVRDALNKILRKIRSREKKNATK